MTYDDRRGQPKLLSENPFQFLKHRLTRQQLVVVNHALQQFAAEASCRDAACKDVRIEENPHETLRKTSSSVK